MQEEQAPKETSKSEKSTRSKRRVGGFFRKHGGKLIGLIFGLLVLGLTFSAGMRYQQHRKPNLRANRPNPANRPTQSRIATGKVDSISADKITAKSTDGKSQTYNITKDTVITKAGKKVTAADIKKDDEVRVTPDLTKKEDARRISIIVPPVKK